VPTAAHALLQPAQDIAATPVSEVGTEPSPAGLYHASGLNWGDTPATGRARQYGDSLVPLSPNFLGKSPAVTVRALREGRDMLLGYRADMARMGAHAPASLREITTVVVDGVLRPAPKLARGATLIRIDWTALAAESAVAEALLSSLFSALMAASKGTYTSRGVVGNTSDPARSSFLNAGAPEILIDLIRMLDRRDRSCFGALENAIQALCNVVYLRAAQEECGRPGRAILEVLCDRMAADAAEGYNINIQIKIARTIDAMCWENAGAQERALNLGALELCVDSLTANGSDPTTVLCLVRCMCTVARTTESLKVLHACGIAKAASRVHAQAWAEGWRDAKRAHLVVNHSGSPGKLVRANGCGLTAGVRAAAALSLLVDRAEVAWEGMAAVRARSPRFAAV
jgi:hypothetical protein